MTLPRLFLSEGGRTQLRFEFLGTLPECGRMALTEAREHRVIPFGVEPCCRQSAVDIDVTLALSTAPPSLVSETDASCSTSHFESMSR